MSSPAQHASDQRAPTCPNPDRASWTEYQRLLTAGVNPTTAAVLAAGRLRPDDERAYWRQLARGTPTTPATRAAQRRRRRGFSNRRMAQDLTCAAGGPEAVSRPGLGANPTALVP
jgi:hypothetical protein